MARREKKVFTLIDFGSDKIGVMYGSCDETGQPQVLAFAQKSSENAICKGEIIDYNKVCSILSAALKNADKSLRRRNVERGKVVYLINGMSVTSRQGNGSLPITGASRKITPEQWDEAVNRAITPPASPDRINFGIYDSFFLIDGQVRAKDPTNIMADRLDAYVHLISTDKNRLDRINAILREVGFEQGGEPMYSAIAPIYGTLTIDERNQGALVIDMGAETTSYSVVVNDGVLASGMIPVGVSHVANDLYVGLDLPFDFCLSFLKNKKLTALRQENVNFLEYTSSARSAVRRIPLDSFEKIMNARLNETFTLIRTQLDSQKLFPLIGTGCILTGGGSLLDLALENLQSVMGMHVRQGEPEIAGVLNDFQSPKPCYAALIGMLKYASVSESGSSNGSITDFFADLFDGVVNRLSVNARG